MGEKTETAPVTPARASRDHADGDRPHSHPGLPYLAFFRRLNEIAAPSSYLEIGTRDGSSLEAFDCDAICVDPVMRPKPAALNRRSRTFCFRMTSDRFFREHDVFSVFPRGVDVAFLDGMHRFEFLLRDFIHTERYCNPLSLVMLHDCFPGKVEIAKRAASSPGGAWAGDAWKLVPVLKELRPDLKLYMADCPPTGLLLVQNLANGSETLGRVYHDLVRQYGTMALADYGLDRLWSDVEHIDSRKLVEDEAQWSIFLPNF